MMNDNQLQRLLKNNQISNEAFERIAYRALLLGTFETICKEIKRKQTATEELSRFRKSSNPVFVTKGIVERYVGCVLSDDEYEQLYLYLKAFFRKNNQRKTFPNAFKEELLKKQKWKCPYCGKEIDLTKAHLDHIIPWDFVGDELAENYQMLCTICNEKKGTSSYFEFITLLQHVKE